MHPASQSLRCGSRSAGVTDTRARNVSPLVEPSCLLTPNSTGLLRCTPLHLPCCSPPECCHESTVVRQTTKTTTTPLDTKCSLKKRLLAVVLRSMKYRRVVDTLFAGSRGLARAGQKVKIRWRDEECSGLRRKKTQVSCDASELLPRQDKGDVFEWKRCDEA